MLERFCELSAAGILTVVVAGGVRDEIQHPSTPDGVKTTILPQIFNLRPGLTTSQQADRRRVLAIVQGNALPGKNDADASHLSEAAETGCGYFITHDKGILNKRGELQAPPDFQNGTCAAMASKEAPIGLRADPLPRSGGAFLASRC